MDIIYRILCAFPFVFIGWFLYSVVKEDWERSRKIVPLKVFVWGWFKVFLILVAILAFFVWLGLDVDNDYMEHMERNAW